MAPEHDTIVVGSGFGGSLCAAALVAAGERIYGIRVVTGTLEDAYLEGVGEGAR